MPETFLGLLKVIGFDFDKYLHRFASPIDGKPQKELQKKKFKLESISFRELSYSNEDGDLIELPECLNTEFVDDKPEIVDEAIRSEVKGAKKNLIYSNGFKSLREPFKKNRSYFGIKLGTQPPANVCPLSIKLAPNATPYRTLQLCYSPPQRVFIRHTIQQL